MISLFNKIRQSAERAIENPNARWARLSKELADAISKHREVFSMRVFASDWSLTSEEQARLGAETYKKYVTKAGKDHDISESEARSLEVIQRVLEVGTTTAEQIREEVTAKSFAEYLSVVVENHEVDESELARLKRLAALAGLTCEEMIRKHAASVYVGR